MARIVDERIDLAVKQAVDHISPEDVGVKMKMEIEIDVALAKILKSTAEHLGVTETNVLNSSLYEIFQFRYFDAYYNLK